MLKHIQVGELTVGMYIQRFGGSWMDHPFWREGLMLRTPDDLARVLASKVQDVWIDTDKGIAPAAPELPAVPLAEPLIPEPAPPQAAPAPTSMDEELRGAVLICRQARDCIGEVFENARMGRLTDSTATRELVDNISASVLRNPRALVSLARLKTADTYTYMHSVAVCALMLALAGQLRLDAEQTRQAGLAGLLHDIGKAGVPLAVLNKPGKLTDEEFEIVRGHPEHGYRMLQACGDVGQEALEACLHHHEKMDGSGYPHRLQGAQISLISRMAAICDVYDAVTSDRPYKRAWDPSEALRRMAEWSGGHFDKLLFQAFVKSIGIYPIGSLVRLTSGRLAVVMDQSGSLVAPMVKVFFSTKSQMRIVPVLLDLSRSANEKIVAREDPEKWRFADLNALWSGLAGQPW